MPLLPPSSPVRPHGRLPLGLAMVTMATLAPVLLPAQSADVVLDHPGRWNIKPVRWAPEVPAAARPRLTQTVNDLIAVLRRMPALAQPRGFDIAVDPRAEWHDLDDQGDGRRPKFAAADISIELLPYEKNARGLVAVADSDPLAVIELQVNDLAVFAGWEAGHGVSSDDADARFLNDPPEPFEMRGQWPVYHDWAERDAWVILTRAQVPLFVPVPRDRYLQFEIEEVRKVAGRQMAPIKLAAPPSNDPAVVAAWKEAQKRVAEVTQTFNEAKAHIQTQLDGLTAQLAGLSPEDRRAPVYLSNPKPTEAGALEFLQPGDSDAKAVVYRNPALIDGRLPPGTPQILALRFESRDAWPELAAKLNEELDWPALQKLLAAAP